MPGPQPTFGFDDAAAHIHRCCTGVGTGDQPNQIGLEFEWLTVRQSDPAERIALAEVQAAVAGPVPAGTVTFEPGGQVELATPPLPLNQAWTRARDGIEVLRGRARDHGIELVAIGLDGAREPRRVLRTARYEAMETAFDRRGPAGRTMMGNTAALQVNVDFGGQEAAARWERAQRIGPALVAMFANSPFADGERSPWLSARLANWWQIDPSRTHPVIDRGDLDRSWLAYALDAEVLLIRAGQDRYVAETASRSFADWIRHGDPLGYPTSEDFAYHLTTLFPPVRPRGWLELRMLDALGDDHWPVATALIAALVYDRQAAEAASDAVRPTRDLWLDAARVGLDDPRLAAAAEGCVDAALAALPRLDVDPELITLVERFVEDHVWADRCPADDLIEAADRGGSLLTRASPAPA